jgi:hypothetical protein
MPGREDKFWKRREVELGSPILSRNLAHFIDYSGEEGAPKWCLLYATAENLYLHTFPKESVISSLLRSTGRRDLVETETVMEISLHSVIEATIIRKTGWLARLFREPETLMIRYFAEEKQVCLWFQLEGDFREIKKVLGIA